MLNLFIERKHLENVFLLNMNAIDLASSNLGTCTRCDKCNLFDTKCPLVKLVSLFFSHIENLVVKYLDNCLNLIKKLY